jgi:predicted component of type VI protein secretion system
MTTFHADEPLEGGWVLEGSDGDGNAVRLVFGETALAQAYLGLTVGRHPALCDRVIGDAGVSRRHLRFAIVEGALHLEDLNSLNGTLLDGREIPRFQPVPVSPGQSVTLGRVTLVVSRLTDG